MPQPQKLGRFEVIGELGKGAMGVVYKARDPIIDRIVAVKTLSTEGRKDPDLEARFAREARCAGILNHPNIITIFDVGEERGIPFIALEYLEGRSLQDLVESHQPGDLRRIVHILTQVANGLHYAHERGVIHRDIKPANIMVLPDGTAKITDFGIARSQATHDTKPGMVLGSVGYMSPEQIKGRNVDGRTDIFSLGVMAYELLSGFRAFPGEQIPEVMGMILNIDPEPPSVRNPELPSIFDPIVAKAMAKDRELRYADAEEFARDLNRGLERVEQQKPHSLSEGLALGSGAVLDKDELFGQQEFDSPDRHEDEVVPSHRLGWPLFLLGLSGMLLIAVLGFLGYLKIREKQEQVFLETVHTSLREADEYLANGKYDYAVNKYEMVLEIDSKNQAALSGLEEARKRYERGKRVEPLRTRAAQAMNAGDFREALALYEQIQEVDPGDVEARRRIPEIKNRIEHRLKVEEALQKAEGLMGEGKYRAAIQVWKDVLTVQADHPGALAGISRAESMLVGRPELDKYMEEADQAFREKNYEQAIRLWRVVLDEDPGNTMVEQRIQEASGLLFYQQQIEAWKRQAETSFQEGEFEKAIRLWDRVIAYQPFDQTSLDGIKRAREMLRD